MEKDKTQPQHISVVIYDTLRKFFGNEIIKCTPREKIGEVDVIINSPNK